MDVPDIYSLCGLLIFYHCHYHIFLLQVFFSKITPRLIGTILKCQQPMLLTACTYCRWGININKKPFPFNFWSLNIQVTCTILFSISQGKILTVVEYTCQFKTHSFSCSLHNYIKRMPKFNMSLKDFFTLLKLHLDLRLLVWCMSLLTNSFVNQTDSSHSTIVFNPTWF